MARPAPASRIVSLVAVAALAGASAHADDTWRLYTERDGLPHPSMRAIHVEGPFVWAGTDAGLARWDGRAWSAWTKSDGLPAASISAIDTDPRTGDLWVGTWGGGLVRFTAGRFDRFTQFNSGIAGNLVFDVAVAEGRVWAATNAGVSSYDPWVDRWDLYFEPRVGTPDTAVTGLAAGEDGLYAGAWSGPPMRYDAARDAWVRAGDVEGDTAVAPVAAGRAVWWVTRTELLRRIRGDRWKPLPLPPLPGAIHALAVSDEGRAWLGTEAGIFVLNAETGPTRVLRDPVRCLAFQGDAVWVGTPRGVARGTRNASDPAETAFDAAARIPSPREDDRQVSIGILGPLARPISRPGATDRATLDTVDRPSVSWAVDRANEILGSPERRPFALVHELYTFESYGWGTAQDSFTVLRDRHDVRGFVGWIGPDARLDTAVALRTEVPVVNVAPTPPTLDERIDPWIFRCGANDPRRLRLLLDHVLDGPGETRPAVVRTPGEESRAGLERWLSELRERGREPATTIDFDAADAAGLLAQRLRGERADVVLTWSDAPTSAAIVRGLREAGWNGLFVGSDEIVGEQFVELAGASPGAVIAPGRCPHYEVVGHDRSDGHDELRRRLRASPVPASPHASRSYEATMHLLVAIEAAGPDRVAIRDELARMQRTTLARLEDGAWVVSPLESP